MSKKQVKEILIDPEWCKGCGICVYYCPKKVLQLNLKNKAIVVKLEDCIGCMLCQKRCPDLAIEVKFEE